MGRRDRGRRDMTGATRPQGSRRLQEGGSSSQYVIHQESGHPLDACLPSRPHANRVLEVVGTLHVIEPCLVGDPAPKFQCGREQELTVMQTHLTKSLTRQQLEGRITPPSDSGGR